ncbi:HD domain-containing protein [Clostridium sp. AL.422]|uniref:HD domain-containing protein n=1 Tax=Clostridium TaxID=1485 RepID=UPI00293DC256|nr:MULTISPECIES: HD domain-containing protein [unclassified Clostridium]MDV4150732.1 HD domain-containing protein [Clostridium sp. AL.422]
MKIIDSIYGEFEIELILEELIKTREVQRLKGIHQGGASYLINPEWSVTRYDHSIGTMLFIRMMGGTIKEQIAGLLHDISHTAFSHVIDFVFKNSNEDYHEKIYDEIIESSTIPKILSTNGYDYKDILFNESKWTILEKKAPKLCADRIDYTLRDMYHYGFISKDEIKLFLRNLSVIENEIVINSVEISEWFVDVYYKEVIGFFMNPLNVYAYDRLSKALEIAVNLHEITLDDLLKEDDYVYGLLRNSSSEEVINLINSINDKVKLIEDKENYNIFQKSKARLIDPTINIEGKCCKASEKSSIVKKLNQKALKKFEEGVFIKIV